MSVRTIAPLAATAPARVRIVRLGAVGSEKRLRRRAAARRRRELIGWLAVASVLGNAVAAGLVYVFLSESRPAAPFIYGGIF